MFWLQMAAGNAAQGFTGNECVLPGGGKVELVPERPHDVQPKGKTAHLKADAR